MINRKTGEATRWEPFASYSLGRWIRMWVRWVHTGETGGILGQTAAALAAVGGALLAWTGLALAWRRFRVSRLGYLVGALRGLKVNVWKLEGTEKWSGLPISLVCAANHRTKAYLLRLIMRESFQETPLGRQWLWNVSKLLN